MTCRETRESLGAYVLGTLESTEAADVEVHLDACASCREELAALAVLPDYLRRVPLELAVEGPPEPGPSDLMLGRLLRAVASERRRRRRTQLLAAAAAVVALVLAAVGVAVAVGGGPGSQSPSATGPTVTVAPTVDPATNVRADLTLKQVAWGSRLTMHLSGVPAGATCSLVAFGPNGEREVAATYKVPETGYQYSRAFTVDGAIALPARDVRRVEVVSAGATLVTVSP